MRIFPILIAASLLALPAAATKPTPEAEPALAGGPMLVQDNTYRYGDMLRSEPGTSVEVCAAACDKDARCAAWTLTPATYSRTPSCELKSNPGAASYRPGAVSGLSETLQLDPVRDGQMRYQVTIPESRQPDAVPLDQLRPSPVPRTFGDPLPKTAPELLGGPGTKISAVIRSEAAPVDMASAGPRETKAVLILKAPRATID